MGCGFERKSFRKDLKDLFFKKDLTILMLDRKVEQNHL